MKKHKFLIKQLLLGTFSLSILVSVQDIYTGISEKSLRNKMQEMNIKVPDANPVYGNPKNKNIENEKQSSQDNKSYGITHEVLLKQMEKMGIKPAC